MLVKYWEEKNIRICSKLFSILKFYITVDKTYFDNFLSNNPKSEEFSHLQVEILKSDHYLLKEEVKYFLISDIRPNQYTHGYY